MAAVSSRSQHREQPALQFSNFNCARHEYVSIEDRKNKITVSFIQNIQAYIEMIKAEDNDLRFDNVVVFEESTISEKLKVSEMGAEMDAIVSRLENEDMSEDEAKGCQEQHNRLNEEYTPIWETYETIQRDEKALGKITRRNKISTLFYETRPYVDAPADSKAKAIAEYESVAKNLRDKPIVMAFYSGKNADLSECSFKPKSAYLAAYEHLAESRFISPIFPTSDEAVGRVARTLGEIAFTPDSPYEMSNFMKGWILEQLAENRMH